MEDKKSLEMITTLEKMLSSEAKELINVMLKVLSDNETNMSIEERVIKALWRRTKDRTKKMILGTTLQGLSGSIYFQDGLATRHNIDHLKDELFVES